MNEQQPGPGPHVSRRAVTRAAGHAAWATPVVLAATAAPAFAATGPADLRVANEGTSILRPPPDGNYVIVAPTSIDNVNTEPSTVASITLVVTMDDGGSWNGLARTPSAVAEGWVASGPVVSDVSPDSVLAPPEPAPGPSPRSGRCRATAPSGST